MVFVNDVGDDVMHIHFRCDGEFTIYLFIFVNDAIEFELNGNIKCNSREPNEYISSSEIFLLSFELIEVVDSIPSHHSHALII